MVDGLLALEADSLPSQCDAMVIGGGIVGACTALSLAMKGVSVAIIDKGDFGDEQSSRNWGWVRKMGRDPREVPLMQVAERNWARWTTEGGMDTGYRRAGITYFADTQADIRRYDNWLAHTRGLGLDTRVLDAAEAQAKAPDSTRRFVGALHTESDGMAEPALATPAIASAARRAGAVVVANCAARLVQFGDKDVVGVHTERGFVRTSRVIVAAGGWSSLFLRGHGIRLPQLKVASQVMRTAPVDAGLEGCGSGNGFGYRKRRDGGYILSARGSYPVDIVPDSFRFFRDFRPSLFAELRSMRFRLGRRSWDETAMMRGWSQQTPSPFERFRHYEPKVDAASLARVAQGIRKAFPAFEGVRIEESWAGLIDITPDALPIISPVSGWRGLYASTGYSGHGFGIAPGAGQLMAEMVCGETPCIDPTAFRFSRFTDGSPIDYWPLGL